MLYRHKLVLGLALISALLVPWFAFGDGAATLAKVVTAAQGAANTLANAWPVKITDGTNTMPTGDASARSIHTTLDNASIPVTGTFWQASQPVSGTVTANQGTAAANTAGWPLIGGIVTRATGSWTSATGINSVVAAAVTGYNSVAVFLNQGSTITGGAVTFEASDDNSNWYAVQGCRMDTAVCATTYTLQQSTNAPFELDVGGATNFRVRLSTGITGTGTVAVGVNPQALPSEPSTTVFQGTSPWTNNVSQFGGSNVVTGTGVGGAGIPRVTISNDSNVLATQSGTWTVQPGNTANTTPWLVQAVPGTANGASVCYLTSAATTNATNCKASAGTLYGYDLVNTTGTIYYLRLYNLAAAPTCSSATGFVRTIPIPASTTGAGLTRDVAVGEAYGTGLGFCLTGGGSSTDNTSAATGVYLTLHYK